MNLFLALLLASFGSNVLIEKEEEDDNKIGEAIGRIQRFCHSLVEFIFRRKQTKEIVSDIPLPTINNLDESSTPVVLTNDLSTVPEDIKIPTWQSLHMPRDCFPHIISKHFSCCAKCIPKSIQKGWTYLRSLTHCLVEHRYFEWFIIISILASSTTLVS